MTFKKFLTDTVRYSNIFTVPTIPQLNNIEMVTFISIILLLGGRCPGNTFGKF